jgi:hypothetical protein
MINFELNNQKTIINEQKTIFLTTESTEGHRDVFNFGYKIKNMVSLFDDYILLTIGACKKFMLNILHTFHFI